MTVNASTRPRVLLTGAGGPAAVSFLKAIGEYDVDLYAADLDRHAAGLYLVPPQRRSLVPPGADSAFVPHVLDYCRRERISVLVPTVDSELLPIARAADAFEAAGVRLLLAEETTLRTCLDKLILLEACEGVVPVPRYAVFDAGFRSHGWTFPLIIKPRSGSGSRGIHLIANEEELAAQPRGAHLLVQDFLPGEEFSVDVLASSTGEIIAAVPRIRLKVDSGIAVTSRTLHDAQLETFARTIAQLIGLRYAANVQFRRSSDGLPKLLEVNPRFPGTMPLTVRSGVNMPLLALRDVLGHPPTPDQGRFDDIAVVRYWTEQFIDPGELAALAAVPTSVTD